MRFFAAMAAWFLLATADPLFQIISPSGLCFTHQNSPTPQKHLLATMGGGVALLDYNNDGLLDVFFVNSGYLENSKSEPVSFRRSEPKYWNRLFRQNKDHSFTDVTVEAGLSKMSDSNYGMGVAAADYDNDGYTDLYVTNYGRNVLYHNNRNGTFSDVTEQAGVAGGGWSASAGFFDYDNDGRLDLFVTRYMQWDFARSKVCARSTYCPPSDFPPVSNILYHNEGGGKFRDVSQPSGISAKQGHSLGVAFADYDGDGLTDIFVANDGMEQFLFHNQGNGRFVETALDAGVALSDDGKPYSGMGVDFRDYDNDGRPDLIVTDLARQVYAVYRNDGKGNFTYNSQASGMSALSAGSSGWGVRWEDFDNDGWKDLLVAQSHVMDNISDLDGTLHYLEPPLLALNHAGHFETYSAGVSRSIAGRGLATGDLDNDGAVDVVLTTLGGSPVVLSNRTRRSNWLTVSLHGTRSNSDGFGATIRVNGQVQYANSAGSYLSASDKRIHFGLAAASFTAVDVQWPSGIHQHLDNVTANQILDVTEPAQ